MRGRGPRIWVGGALVVLAVFGFGGLEAWPFTSWSMFSHVEPETVRVAKAVAVSHDGSRRPVVSSSLPLGLQSHRLLARFRAGAAARDEACASLLRLAGAAEVEVIELSWDPLERAGSRPADVRERVVAVCR